MKWYSHSYAPQTRSTRANASHSLHSVLVHYLSYFCRYYCILITYVVSKRIVLLFISQCNKAVACSSQYSDRRVQPSISCEHTQCQAFYIAARWREIGCGLGRGDVTASSMGSADIAQIAVKSFVHFILLVLAPSASWYVTTSAVNIGDCHMFYRFTLRSPVNGPADSGMHTGGVTKIGVTPCGN